MDLDARTTEKQLRHCCAELARRLRSGATSRAEDFFSACPQLAGCPETALDLIYHEYNVRCQLGAAPEAEEYYQRFPQWREDLYHQFQMHQLLGDDRPHQGELDEMSPWPGAITPPRPWKSNPPNLEILEEIARGSMGVVYRAWQVNVRRVVALKIILARSLSSADDFARFRQEAEATGRLVHPNIVQLFEVGEWEHCPFLVLEHVAGRTLADYWCGGPKPFEETAALVLTLARAVQFAHEQGVIHRDFRSGNILLTKEGAPKIFDFGLAKLMIADERLTMTGQVLGTPSYMAPEQADGLQRDIGPAVDVYALGAVLYEGLTCRPPFRGATILDTLQQVIELEPVPPRRLRSDVPRDLETICLKCLQKQPERRYASAEELVEDLNRFLTGRPILARPVTVAERAYRLCRRNPMTAIMAIAITLVVSAAMTLVTWKWRDELHARGQAERAWKITLEEQTHAQAQKRIADRVTAGVVLDQGVSQGEHGNLDYSLLLIAHSLEQAVEIHDAALERVARINLTAFRAMLLRRRAVLKHSDWAWAAAYSPRDKLLVTACKDKTARIWDTETGKQIGESLSHAEPVWCVDFSRDGQLILTGSGDPQTGTGELRLWEAHTGHPRGPALLKGKALTAAMFSPDGKTLLALDANLASSQAHLFDLGTGNALNLRMQHPERVLTAIYSPDGSTVLTGGSDGTARLWRVADGAAVGPVFDHRTDKMRPPQRHPFVVTAAFSPDGKILATGSQIIDIKQQRLVAGEVRLWKVDTGELLVPPLAHRGPLKTVAFSPDGNRILSGGIVIHPEKQDFVTGEARLWDVESGRQLGPDLEHGRPVWSATFSRNGKVFVTGAEDGYAKFWLTATTQQLGKVYARGNARSVVVAPDGLTSCITHTDTPAVAELWEMPPGNGAVLCPPHEKHISELTFSPDGKLFATVSDDETARIWDGANARPSGIALPHCGGNRPVLFSPDGIWFLSAPQKGTSQLYDPRTGEPHGPAIPWDAAHAAFSADGNEILFSDGRSHIWWDVVRGQPKIPARTGGDGENAAVIRSDGKYLATRRGNEIQIWNMAADKPTCTRLHQQGSLSAFAFNGDGSIAATGSEDGTVQLWRTENGKTLGKVLEHQAPIRGVVFSPDDRILLTWSASNNVRLWDIASGLPLRPPVLAPAEVTAAVFTPDSQTIVLAHGKSVWLCDVATSKRLGPPLQHPDVVTKVAVHADGRSFATVCGDKMVRQWDVPTPTPGDPSHLKAWLEVLTGRRLSEIGTLREIDGPTLVQDRCSLHNLGQEPFPRLGRDK